MFIFGVLLYILLIMFAGIMSGSVLHFIDIPSFIFVFVANIAILMSTKSFKDFWYGIRVVSLKEVELDGVKIENSIRVFALLYKSSFGIGVFGFLIGLISVLNYLDDPSHIGPAIGISLLTVFYSILFALAVLIPGRFALKKIEVPKKKSSKSK